MTFAAPILLSISSFSTKALTFNSVKLTAYAALMTVISTYLSPGKLGSAISFSMTAFFAMHPGSRYVDLKWSETQVLSTSSTQYTIGPRAIARVC